MSKKDYIAIAEQCHDLYSRLDLYTSPKELFDSMVSAIADMFEDDNSRFDRDRFFIAIYQRTVTKK